MKRTASIIFRSAFLILIGVVLGMYLGGGDMDGQPFGLSLNRSDKMSKVLELVQYNYVDSVNVDSIEGATVNELLQKLDPHSLYLPPRQATAVNERLEGGFTGLGIEYSLLRDTLVITQVYPGGPAAKAGITGGTKVITVNGKQFAGIGITDSVVTKTLLQKGKQVNAITISALLPDNIITPKTFTLKPGRVPLSSLDAAYVAGNEVGYIKISKFAATTNADFKKAIAKLKAEGVKKLVLDLRGNGGGYLTAATEMADEFLPKGDLIVYTKGVHEPRTDYFATDSGSFEEGSMAVLIDEYSASASEILSGALQDLDRAVIVGRRSFGKGLVQQQFPFDDGSAVNLTVARYYTPSGRSIQKSYSRGITSYRNELADRMRKGELFSADMSVNDSAMNKRSPYRTSSGKKVFSGGGIMPDIFVPADTTQSTPLIISLTDAQAFTSYVLDKMQPMLRMHTVADKFVNTYTITDAELDSFMQYASNLIKPVSKTDVLANAPAIKTLLKAYAARFKWGDSAYYRAVNNNDSTFNKALTAIR
ncbi:S41 family peptidase [Mucilaginibacter sp. JRF]|uniref:S41 family peptidase n=1 Tax=Mucilaginibacter sp. JRF TaxID=2780088 RepID=UPI00187E09C7|nr:S41 family peptidase [Mucilaginibacter sp. JRF]MBE9584531.1 S41 family peptidase [Mucilaginibacter sp. JRF]